MELRSGTTKDPRGSRGGTGEGSSPSARQLLARLDARPLAARAAADVSALARKASATLRLRTKEAVDVLYSADIEVTDSRLPHATQHRQSQALSTCTMPPRVTQGKASCASKLPQPSGQFSVELLRSPAGFGLTLSGGRGVSGDAPLAVGGLLKDGPAQRCGRLQVGDHVLHVNGKSTQGLTHAQVVERIRAGGPRLCLVLHRPQEIHASRLEGAGGRQQGDRIPDPKVPETLKSRSISISPVHHPPKIQARQEPRLETVAEGLAVSAPEQRTEDLDDLTPGSPGPWLVPSEERLSRALGVPGTAPLAQEMAAGRRRH
uniref:MAGI family member, X-linked n=1 Tax=Jaculus jaculus TaxID=51337 RepID=A0A8C5KEP6_JACJA